MPDGDWHYALGNDQFGPVSPETMQDLIQKGAVKRTDRVWRPGMNQWMPAGDLGALEKFFRPSPAQTIPVPQPMPIPQQAAGDNDIYPVAPPAPIPIPQPIPTAAPMQLPADPSIPMPLPMPLAPSLQYATPVQYGRPPHYAGFWRRFAAYFIDGIALDIVLIPLGLAFGNPFLPQHNANPFAAFAGIRLVGTMLNWVIIWAYFAGMESSGLQATLGKLALGIQVTDLNGQRIDFGTATGRYFGKILSGLILGIGFLMVAWTEKKQALHDFLANTLVICKP
jgi:uncharacterized RDD family membrane protein YckC